MQSLDTATGEKTQGEAGHLQAKKRGLEQILPSQSSDKNLSCQHLDPGLLGSRTIRQ